MEGEQKRKTEGENERRSVEEKEVIERAKR